MSASSAGLQGTTASGANAVSAGGDFVAFTSASALPATPTGGKVQLYVRDRTTGATTLAPSSTRGAAAIAHVETQDVGNAQLSICGDGNATTVARTVTRSAPVTSRPRPRARARALALRAALTKAGRVRVVLKPRRRPARGRYVARVGILSPAAGPKTRSRALKVAHRR